MTQKFYYSYSKAYSSQRYDAFRGEERLLFEHFIITPWWDYARKSQRFSNEMLNLKFLIISRWIALRVTHYAAILVWNLLHGMLTLFHGNDRTFQRASFDQQLISPLDSSVIMPQVPILIHLLYPSTP